MRLWLDIEPGSDPIRGSLGPADGAGRAFCGWMELAASLDALITNFIDDEEESGTSTVVEDNQEDIRHGKGI